ncbi:nuclear transport factor 2 family protein [Paenibacillus pinisoli]|uniref:Nuclear transport factor 2 family protein n=1 Tax=Paenibacillus pinisoli TaxID=1276110 RepID=A0A3A6PEF5_9BACL|nr:nuclear transport factor 2 family protein [Paenibacillus pinisoli]RJX39257.1 nuclear transport factor 2 family protein [Paenibacillus pinisoli]
MSHQQALKQYIEATNTHHFENVKKLLHPEAVYWFSDRTCRTIDDIQAYFETAWDIIEEEVYSANDVSWISVDERSATCLYTYRFEGFHEGKPVSGSGRATNVFVKSEHDGWQLIHEHLSGDV